MTEDHDPAQDTDTMAWRAFSRLAEALAEPRAFPHPVQHIERIDTHISLLVLTGRFAYKIKRPVKFDFADFSTLELRHAACLKELCLNRRTAPELYMDVVSINQGADGLKVEGDGPVVDYAVRMRQFCNRNRLDRVLERGELDAALCRQLASNIADFHENARQLHDTDAMRASRDFEKALTDNHALLSREQGALALCARTAEENQSRDRQLLLDSRSLLLARAARGMIRDCHGDLHLENLIVEDGRVRAFDCVEFNDTLRCVDSMSDLAFLLMDLESRGADAHANLVLNEYLEQSGDFEGPQALALFKSYRAMVRAKVAALGLLAADCDPEQRSVLRAKLERYLRLVRRYHQRTDRGALLICSGLSGSGKSWLARRLGCALGAIVLRSDVERKRLYPDDSAPELRYSAPATERTYDRMTAIARPLLECGWRVIADATCLKRWQRERLKGCARAAGVPSLRLHAQAPLALLEQRIRARRACGGDASEADVAVLHAQQWHMDPVDDPHGPACLRVDTSRPVDWCLLLDRIERLGKH
ncbi:MAG: AAA family ATPase [Gammaproteobacteria bacterium]|nr:AAA family ATPase [Gammaproteobacteria bacterium]